MKWRLLSLLALFLFVSKSVNSQGYQKLFDHVRQDDQYQALVVVNANEFVVAGFTGANSCRTLKISKLSMSNCATVWTNSYDLPDLDCNPIFKDIFQTSDGGYITTGWTNHFSDTLKKMFLLKVDAVGATQWVKLYGDPNDGMSDGGWTVKQTPDGGYIVAGFYAGNSALLKTDATGNVTWLQTYEAGDLSDVEIISNGYVAVGSYSMNAKAEIIRTDMAGNIIWGKKVSTVLPGQKRYSKIVKSIEGGYFITGWMQYPVIVGANYEPWLTKVDTSGNIIWQKSVGQGTSSPTMDLVRGTVQLSDTNYVVAGTYARQEGLLFNVDKNGNVNWAMTYGNSMSQQMTDEVDKIPGQAGFVAVGESGNCTTSDFDMYIVKTDYSGSTGIACAEQSVTLISNTPAINTNSISAASQTPTVIVPPLPTPTVSVTMDSIYCLSEAPVAASANLPVICSGGSSSLSVSGGLLGSGAKWYWYENGCGTGSAIDSTLTINVNPTNTTTYYVRAEGACNTTTCVAVTVTISVAPTASLSATPAACGNSNGTATASPSGGFGSYTYSWNNGQTTQTSTGLSQGTYTVLITDGAGCTISDTVSVSTINSLIVSSTVTPASCGNNNGSATAVPSGGTGPYTYSWNNGQTTQTSTGMSQGTYTVLIIDSLGCAQTNTVLIASSGGPIVNTALSNVLCNGQSTGTATVTAGGGTAPYSYLWSNSQTSAIATNLQAGTYTVLITDSLGCATTHTVTITEPAVLTASAVAQNSNCGSADGTATVIASGGTTVYTYSWSNGQSMMNVSNLTAGNYTVTVLDANNCIQTATVAVADNPAPVATISADTTIIKGNNVMLSAGGGTSYLWSPFAGLSCNTCSTPIAAPENNTTYCVIVSSGNCADTACVTINVETTECGNIFIPNVFSPNNDNVNDLECVYGKCISKLLFIIYDRWGNKIFETTNQEVCWDGTYNGKPLDSDVFIYRLFATMNDLTEVEKKGNITLLR